MNSATATLTGYVSPNSASATITVLSVNGAPPPANQMQVNPTTVALSTAASGNCTTPPAGETCTIPLAAPAGAVRYRFQIKDSFGRVLSENTLTFTIASGTGNQNFVAPLDGVVNSVAVFAPTLTAGTSFSGPITVQAHDASGALIVGSAPYANAFTLTDNDASGHTSLTNGSVTGTTVTVASPNDVVILNYDGQPIPQQPTFTASIPPG